MRIRPLKTISFNIIAVLISVVAFVPIYIILVNALKTKADAATMGIGLPTSLHFENFATVIEKGKLGQSFSTACFTRSVRPLSAQPWPQWARLCFPGTAL